MVATLPFNRVAAQFDTPEPELPKSARERGKLWSDTVFQAVFALKKQLRSPDAHIVMAAAEAILEMERTRMRHSKNLAGSQHVSEAQEEFEAERERDLDYSPPDHTEAHPEPEEPSEALVSHAREIRESTEKSGTPLTERQSLRVTQQMLQRMGLEAEDIAPGQFGAALREKRHLWERTTAAGEPADSPTVPLCSAGSRGAR